MVSLARRAAAVARTKLLDIRPTDPVPYATHLPVLIALAPILRPRRVLELGSGPFSTALFLDRSVFPDLESLVSYEDDAEWEQVVRDAVGTDHRLDFRMVDAVRDAVPERLDEFDLIFIDDSRTPAERVQTIQTVQERSPRGVVLIHDYEQRPYRRASRGYDNRTAFSSFTPQVGACWPDSEDDTARQLDIAFRKASHAIEMRRRDADVTDVAAWKSLLAPTG